jgi:thermostable 8-oxoguanine DNA glycosylase
VSTFLHIFENLIFEYKEGKFGTLDEQFIAEPDQKQIEKNLITCILSSNWAYERAVNAADNFINIFGSTFEFSESPDEQKIELLLRSPAVRHRFPKSKAIQIRSSLESMLGIGTSFSKYMNQFSTEHDAREYVSSTFAGMGYKQSSMFLRDIGIAQNLAVIDLHIIWYLTNAENIEVGTLSKKRYLFLEDYLRSMSQKIGISMIALDRLIWVTVREFRKLKRKNGCEIQFALPLGV